MQEKVSINNINRSYWLAENYTGGRPQPIIFIFLCFFLMSGSSEEIGSYIILPLSRVILALSFSFFTYFYHVLI